MLKYKALHSYNFVLNKALNNNDFKHIANMVLNEAPNSNSSTHVVNNVCLTTMGAQNFKWWLYSHHVRRKANLPETRDNDTITRKCIRKEINFALRKNGGYIPSSLVLGRLVWAGR